MSDWTIKPRHLVFALLPLVVVGLLMVTNENVDYVRHFQRVQPFFLMAVAKFMLIVVLVAQHPEPPDEVSWWEFWKWVDPVTIVLVLMFIGSGSYYFAMFGGFSTRFTVPEYVFNWIRAGLWVDGYLSIVILQEMIYRAIEGRRNRRMKRRRYYDMGRDANRNG
ncbi:MAG: hypothetical protein K5924_12760 [Chloroflexi bacterium]|nr:hypothetical protein [Chloroflexota bacterium]